MTFWEPLGLLGILALWAALGLVPWSVALIAARGRGALVALPFAFAAGIGGGALVPALVVDDGLGFSISLLTALAAGAVVSTVVVRRATGNVGRKLS